MYDNDGALASVYDPYGKATSALGSHATINPLRYRGYVFDHETGLYYLQSRYYDPETGRFINEDNNFSNNNLFMYCANNPVNSVDTNGQHWYFLWLDDLINDFVEAINELLTCVSNIVYGQAAYERSFYDPEGAAELWNSRPYQNTTPSPEMQMFTALAYDSSTVYDISLTVSVPHTNVYVKAGVSRVLSPKKDIDATYVHVGGGLSTPSALPVAISYSVGGVQGVMEKENYAGHFFDKGASILFGFDYCFWPNGSSAYSFVVSNSYGVYYGYDYYWCID